MIHTSNLRKRFTTRRGAVDAVRGVDLHVGRGEIFGFLGPNGAGKTTTVRMLVTLLRPEADRAVVAGFDLLTQPDQVRGQVGYVSQAGGVDGAATPRANLLLQARLCGLSRAAAAQHGAELFERLELTGIADRPAATLSGGQRRRVALALGMVHKPSLLFLDEPTAGLDPQARARLWDEVRALRAEGVSVFLTTHYLEEADALCDRLAIIDGGRIVAEGSPRQLKQEIAGDVVTLRLAGGEPERASATLGGLPFTREVAVDDSCLRVYVDGGEAALPALLHALDADGLQVATVALSSPSLDDVFLRQTGRRLREPGAAA